MPRRHYTEFKEGDDPRMYDWPDENYRWWSHEPAFHGLVVMAALVALACGLIWAF